jgi:hypothetical protein
MWQWISVKFVIYYCVVSLGFIIYVSVSLLILLITPLYLDLQQLMQLKCRCSRYIWHTHVGT